jgi:glutamyl-tRNA synthetase
METVAPRNERPVRVRIAPSPTGDPHVGTAYIALFNYVFARQHGGTFILRIEDTDQTRARSDSEQAIFDALHWVGLSWDEGPDVGGPHAPYRQSERGAIYREHAEILMGRDRAYRCFCTSERLNALRVQQTAEKRSLGYDRHCRFLDKAEAAQRAAAGEPYTVRLAVPADGTGGGVVRFHDQLRGDVEFAVAQIDDQVLLKSDGMPTYHLANVVDDHLMEISHVIRAEEWISSTPKHVLLYDAFGWQAPTFIHMPLLRNLDKSKISKRKNPVSINYYREIGILPHALLNFLGLMGWSFGDDREKFTLQEMIDVFSWDRISLGGPVFNLEKLRWLNEKYIHELSYEELADALLGWRLRRDHLIALLPLVRERIKQLDDFIPMTSFFFSGDIDLAPIAAELTVPETLPKDLKKQLLFLVEKLEEIDGWQVADLERVTREFVEAHAHGGKTSPWFMLLRLLVTGRKTSPPLFDTMAVLGKEMTRRRLRQGAEVIGKQKEPAAPKAAAPAAPRPDPAPKAPAAPAKEE